MTGAAGFAVLHSLHGRLVRTAPGLVQVGVATVATLQHLDVDGVREGDVADVFVREENVAGMAPGAVTGDAKSLLAVMAGAAGLAPFHSFHADVVAVALLFENFRVAFTAVGAMFPMTEFDFTDCPGLYIDLVHHAPDTTPSSSQLPHTNGIEDGRQSDYQQDDYKEPGL